MAKQITVEEAEALPASWEDPAVVFGLGRKQVYTRYEPGGTWYEPANEFGAGSLFPEDGPFVRLVPEED